MENMLEFFLTALPAPSLYHKNSLKQMDFGMPLKWNSDLRWANGGRERSPGHWCYCCHDRFSGSFPSVNDPAVFPPTLQALM